MAIVPTLPPMRPRQRADQRLVRPWLRRRPGVAAVRRDDDLADTRALPGYRRADGNRRAIELPVLAGTFRPVFTPPSPPVTGAPRPAPAAPRPAAARACHRRQRRSAQPAAARSAPAIPRYTVAREAFQQRA